MTPGTKNAYVLPSIVGSKLPVIVAVTYNSGGGTTRHVKDLCIFLAHKYVCIVLSPVKGTIICLCVPGADDSFELTYDVGQEQEHKKLVRLLHRISVIRVHYHHLCGVPTNIRHLADTLGVPYDFTFHDYYSVCPQIHLVRGGLYCGEKGVADCGSCLSGKVPSIDICAWREQSYQFLKRVNRLWAPSDDVKRRIGRYYSDLEIKVIPNPELSICVELGQTYCCDKALKVLVIGHIIEIKGGYVVSECASVALKKQLPIDFRMVGHNYLGLVESENLSIYGEYVDFKLPELISDYRPDIIWFPSLCPETFCYTLSTAMQAGIPIFSTDLGALPERLSGYDAKIYSWKLQAEEINDLFMDYFTSIRRGEMKTRNPWTPRPIEEFLNAYSAGIKNTRPPPLKHTFAGVSLNGLQKR